MESKGQPRLLSRQWERDFKTRRPVIAALIAGIFAALLYVARHNHGAFGRYVRLGIFGASAIIGAALVVLLVRIYRTRRGPEMSLDQYLARKQSAQPTPVSARRDPTS
jgi:uncharacterized membrane protein YeaQ/YmgE (transglycosylase-associated protein family)